jgi:hypothetical protein
MIYYFLIITLLLFSGSRYFSLGGISLYSFSYKQEDLIFLLVSVFLCCGYMTGSDWRNYEPGFYEASWGSLSIYNKEQVFYILMIISKILIPDFFVFLILCKIITFYLLLSFFKRYSANSFHAFFFYIPLFGLFLFIDNPLRFMIAIAFVTFSYKFLLNSKFFSFAILVLAGSLFHITVIFFIPFFFLRKLKVSGLLLLGLYIIWIFLLTTKNLLFLFQYLEHYSPLIYDRFKFYLIEAEGMTRLISLGTLMNIIFFCWIVFNENEIKTSIKHGDVFYSFALLYLFVAKLGVIFPVVFRFIYLFAPFFIVAITFLFQSFRRGLNPVLSFGVILYIYLFAFRLISNHYVYIPYSNYIVHLANGEKPSYEYRSKYNVDQFFLRKGYYPTRPE